MLQEGIIIPWIDFDCPGCGVHLRASIWEGGLTGSCGKCYASATAPGDGAIRVLAKHSPEHMERYLQTLVQQFGNQIVDLLNPRIQYMGPNSTPMTHVVTPTFMEKNKYGDLEELNATNPSCYIAFTERYLELRKQESPYSWITKKRDKDGDVHYPGKTDVHFSLFGKTFNIPTIPLKRILISVSLIIVVGLFLLWILR